MNYKYKINYSNNNSSKTNNSNNNGSSKVNYSNHNNQINNESQLQEKQKQQYNNLSQSQTFQNTSQNSLCRENKFDVTHMKVSPGQLNLQKNLSNNSNHNLSNQNQNLPINNSKNIKSNRDYSINKNFATHTGSGVEEKEHTYYTNQNSIMKNNSSNFGNLGKHNPKFATTSSNNNCSNQNGTKTPLSTNLKHKTNNSDIQQIQNSAYFQGKTQQPKIQKSHQQLKFNITSPQKHTGSLQQTNQNQDKIDKNRGSNNGSMTNQSQQLLKSNTGSMTNGSQIKNNSNISQKSQNSTQNQINQNNSQKFYKQQQSQPLQMQKQNSSDKKNQEKSNKNVQNNTSSVIPFLSCFTNANESQTETFLENPPMVEFMVKDKDTNQVYDIRSIDQMQQFESANKKEYFDKLKKRHSSMWQGWWNQKRDHNQKLLISVRQNDYYNAQLMLDPELGDLKADQNIKDDNGWTPLHFAAFNGNFDMIVLLLKNDSDIDSENNNAQNPLIIAAQKGHAQIVSVLLNYGADINHQDMHFNTALHYACLFEKINIIEVLLLKPSIQVKLKNSDRKTALEIANSKQAKQLFEHFQQRQNQMAFNASKVTIQEVSNESMFNLFEQDSQQNQSRIPQIQEESECSPSKKKASSFQQQNSQINSSQRLGQGGNNSQLFLSKNASQQSQNNHQSNSQLQQSKQLQQQNQQYIQQQQLQISNKYGSGGNSKQKKLFTPFSTNTGTTYYQSGQTTAYSSPKKSYGSDRFKIMNLIGRGSFGEVYLVQDKEDGKQYAMKVLHKSKILGQNLVKYAMTERNVLSITSHPYIIKLRFAFQNDKELFLIMDYASGGDMSKQINTNVRLSENVARIYLAEIITALETLHSHDIIFRDLKPENIVIDREGHAMLTDFGLSKEGVHDNKGAKSFCGSLAYLAPEMLKRQGHGKAVDWYHCGVLLYEMLVGSPPFMARDREDIMNHIQSSDVKLPNYISNEAQSLIRQLMTKNPVQRLGSGQRDAIEIKQHPFFQDLDWNLLFQRKIQPPLKSENEPILENRFAIPNDLQWDNSKNNNKNHIQGWSFIHQDDNISKNDLKSHSLVGNKNNIISNNNINNLSKIHSEYSNNQNSKQQHIGNGIKSPIKNNFLQGTKNQKYNNNGNNTFNYSKTNSQQSTANNFFKK